MQPGAKLITHSQCRPLSLQCKAQSAHNVILTTISIQPGAKLITHSQCRPLSLQCKAQSAHNVNLTLQVTLKPIHLAGRSVRQVGQYQMRSHDNFNVDRSKNSSHSQCRPLSLQCNAHEMADKGLALIWSFGHTDTMKGQGTQVTI